MSIHYSFLLDAQRAPKDVEQLLVDEFGFERGESAASHPCLYGEVVQIFCEGPNLGFDDYYQEQYGFLPSVQVTFFPDRSKMEEANRNMARIVSWLLEIEPGDAAFENGNASEPSVQRIKGEVSVYTSLWDGTPMCNEVFLSALTVPYTLQRLPSN